MSHLLRKGPEEGFSRYLNKPINLKEFMEAMDEALETAEKTKRAKAEIQPT